MSSITPQISRLKALTATTPNNLIRNYNINVTLAGGEGNDTIYSSNTGVTFIYTSGNDVIKGFRHPYSTLQFMANTDQINRKAQIRGEDIIFTIGEYTLTLLEVLGWNCDTSPQNWNIIDKDGNKLEFDFLNEGTEENDNLSGVANNVSIIGRSGDDTISNSGSEVVIDGGTGNDSISNSGSNVTINAGAGDDYIFNRSANVLIDGGTDNDLLLNNIEANNSTILGGNGNDFVRNKAKNVLIDTGAGDDTVSSDARGDNDLNYRGDYSGSTVNTG